VCPVVTGEVAWSVDWSVCLPKSCMRLAKQTTEPTEPVVQNLIIMFMVMSSVVEVHKMSAMQLSKLQPAVGHLKVRFMEIVDRVPVRDMETAELQ